LIGTEEKFHSFFLDNILPVNIPDGTSSRISEKIVHATSSLSLNDVLFIPKFSVTTYQQNYSQNRCRAIFYHSYSVF